MWAETATDEERAAIVERAIPLVERQLELVRARQAKLDEFAAELEEQAPHAPRAPQRRFSRRVSLGRSK